MKKIVITLMMLIVSACSSYSVKNQQDDIKEISEMRDICKQGYEYLAKAKDATQENLSKQRIMLCGAKTNFVEAQTPEIRQLKALFSSGIPNKDDVFKAIDLAEKSIRDYKFQ